MATGGKLAFRKMLVIAAIGLVIILGLTIAVIVLAVNGDEERKNPSRQHLTQPVAFDIMTFFNISDGLNLKWFQNLKVETDLEHVRSGKYNVVNVKVGLTSVLGQKVPVVHGGQYQLRELIGSVKTDNIVMNFETFTNEIAEATVDVLKSEVYNQPIIFTLPILDGFDLMKFKNQLTDLTSRVSVALNFDVTSVCCDESIGTGTVEYIAGLARDSKHTVLIGVDAAIVEKSWSNLKWLLDRVRSCKLVISANEANTDDDVVYDVLLARNDLETDRVYYSLKDTLYNTFVYVATTAGNPLIYFNINPRDAGKLIWSHNTDTWELIHKATTGDTMMVEADIRLQQRNNTRTLVMAHDKGDDNNVTFEQFLNEVIKVDKGMKFDFKELEAVQPALKIVSSRRDQIKGPIWTNADILPGPGNKPVTISADAFLKASQEFPAATLSLGWTTKQKGDKHLQYNMTHVQQMHALCKQYKLRQPVTFPIRAEQALDSWRELDWLLKQSRKYTLTIWTGHGDNVTKADMDKFKRKFEMSRVYFDLPENLRPTLP